MSKPYSIKDAPTEVLQAVLAKCANVKEWKVELCHACAMCHWVDDTSGNLFGECDDCPLSQDPTQWCDGLMGRSHPYWAEFVQGFVAFIEQEIAERGGK
jgi:hypothetical protein